MFSPLKRNFYVSCRSQDDFASKKGKNKELEARCNEVEKRYADEKVSHENYELIIKKLQNKVATLIEEKEQIKNSYEKKVGIKESQISTEEQVKKAVSGIVSSSVTLDGEQESLGSLVSLASLELLNATTTETKTSGSIFRKDLHPTQSQFDPFVSKDSREGTSTKNDTDLNPRIGHSSSKILGNESPRCRSDSLTNNKVMETTQSHNSIKQIQTEKIQVGLPPTIENVAREIKDTTMQQVSKNTENVPTPRSSNSVTPVHSFDPYEKK